MGCARLLFPVFGKASKSAKLAADASPTEEREKILEQAQDRIRKAEEDIQREIGGKF